MAPGIELPGADRKATRKPGGYRFAQGIVTARAGVSRQLVQVRDQAFDHEVWRGMARLTHRQGDVVECRRRLQAVFQFGQLFEWIALE